MNKENIFKGMKLIIQECANNDDFSECKNCPFYEICSILQNEGEKKYNDTFAFIPEFWDEWMKIFS